MFAEFRQFILRGNVLDLAVAVILGAAFNAIVSSMIGDVIAPLLLQPAMTALGVAELEKVQWMGVKYGKFLAAVLGFMVTAAVVFALVKVANTLSARKAAPPATPVAPPAPSKEELLLTEIRDLLRDRR